MKKLLRKRFVSIILSIVMLSVLNQAWAASASRQLKPTIDLEWETYDDFNYLVGATTKTMDATYTYDSNWQRSEKTVNGATTIFAYQDSILLWEDRDGEIIDYLFSDDSLYWYDVIGFTYHDNTYYYEKDDGSNTVTGIRVGGELIAKYGYAQGLVTSVLGFEDGKWIDKTEDCDFIGNINLIRYNSYYFDAETNWYYYSGSYFNTVNNCFVTCIADSGNGSGGMRYLPPQVDIDNAYASNLSNWGAGIAYSSGWYNSLTNAELFARLIYGEANNNASNQNALCWVVLNRLYYNTSEFGGSTLKGVMTKGWDAILGTSTNTNEARNPDKTSQRWKNCVFMGTIISYTTTQCADENRRTAINPYSTRNWEQNNMKLSHYR